MLRYVCSASKHWFLYFHLKKSCLNPHIRITIILHLVDPLVLDIIIPHYFVIMFDIDTLQNHGLRVWTNANITPLALVVLRYDEICVSPWPWSWKVTSKCLALFILKWKIMLKWKITIYMTYLWHKISNSFPMWSVKLYLYVKSKRKPKIDFRNVFIDLKTSGKGYYNRFCF